MLKTNRGDAAADILNEWPTWTRRDERRYVLETLWRNNAGDVLVGLCRQGFSVLTLLGEGADSPHNIRTAGVPVSETFLRILETCGCPDLSKSELSAGWITALAGKNEPAMKKFLSCGAQFKSGPLMRFRDVFQFLYQDHYQETLAMFRGAIDPKQTFDSYDFYIVLRTHDKQWRDFLITRAKCCAKEPTKTIRMASEANDLELVKLLVEAGGDPTDHEEVTTPVMAVSGGGGQSLTFSASRYAHPQYTGRNALYYAIANDNVEMVSYLIDRGADPNDVLETQPSQELVAAFALRAVQIGEQVNIRAENGWLSLMALARARHNPDVMKAMEEGAAKQEMTHNKAVEALKDIELVKKIAEDSVADSSARATAVRIIAEQEALFRKVRTACIPPYTFRGCSAAENILDPQLRIKVVAHLGEMANQDLGLERNRMKSLFESVLSSINDPKALAELAANKHIEDSARVKIIARVQDETLLATLAKSEGWSVANAAVDKIQRQDLLAEVAKTARGDSIRADAIKRLDDRETLMGISRSDRSKDVRKDAEARLKALGLAK